MQAGRLAGPVFYVYVFSLVVPVMTTITTMFSGVTDSLYSVHIQYFLGVIIPGTGSQPLNTASPNRLLLTVQ
jgi:hypothetical protein